jgi:hypothetical protein
MKNFFSDCGWLIFSVICTILVLFNIVEAYVYILAFTMINVLGIVNWKFRRYFLTVISIFTFVLVLNILLYIIQISNGQIVGVSAGTVVITETSVDGRYLDTCVVTVKANEVTPNGTVKITFGDHIDGATDIFASVVISEGGKTPIIESNLNCEVTKVNDTVYHVRMTITEGSHGTVTLSVLGNGITTTQNTNSY